MKRLLTAVFLSIIATNALAIDICVGSNRQTCVVDGDTLWLNGKKYRPMGYDTPEITTNICGGEKEKALGMKATKRLIELLNQYEWQLIPSGKKDQYERGLATLIINGKDAGDILVSEGLARYWPDGHEFWCP